MPFFLLWALLVPVQMGRKSNEGHFPHNTSNTPPWDSAKNTTRKNSPSQSTPAFLFQMDGIIKIFLQLFQGFKREKEKTQLKFNPEKAWSCQWSYFWAGWPFPVKIL